MTELIAPLRCGLGPIYRLPNLLESPIQILGSSAHRRHIVPVRSTTHGFYF